MRETSVDFRWRYQGLDGADVTGPDERFADQSAAEAWLGDVWQDLLDAGVHQVTLLQDEAEVYGPMSLHPAG
jgi:hypothetical protein